MKGRLNKFLARIQEQYGKLPKDLHITKKAGALVAISGGHPILAEEPTLTYCPLYKSLFKADSIDRKSIMAKFEIQAEKWGMFTPDRKVSECSIVVPFGASEMIMYALERKGVEAAVLVCEGAGTVITDNPSTVQGIGAYMNGIFYTTAVPEIILKLKNQGACVLSEKGTINQLGGVKKAYRQGYRKIAVTVRGDQIDQIKKIRDFQFRNPGFTTVIMAVCNTGISGYQARVVRDNADLAWACASSKIRSIVGPASMVQLGMKIPVFITTSAGIELLSHYSNQKELLSVLESGSKKYITSSRCQQGGTKFNMGRFSVYLYPVDKLPVYTPDQPQPLA